MKDKTKYWIDMAEYDLVTARVMLKGGRYLYVGFMCHQVIEKAFKGYYAFIHRDNPPFTHNLRYLAQESGLFVEMDENQKDLVELVGPLNIEARYPTYKEKMLRALSKERCEEILRRTEELYQWTKNRL